MTFRIAVASPVGPLTLVASERGLCAIEWGACGVEGTGAADVPTLREAARQLGEYFGGLRWAFDLPLDLDGTPFQIEAWKALIRIPFGKTASYGEQAQCVGRLDAARAVGAANASNPLPIVIPCHRLIGATGGLTGYGGGLEAKRWLLEFEAREAREAQGLRPPLGKH